jgi:cell wall-associated NlpC family hydrolase
MTIRQAIASEAMQWLKTPWHHLACTKGAGVDCVGILRGVYNNVGLTNIADSDIPYYPADIMLNRSEETVLDVISRYAKEVDEPKTGDVILWKFGRIYSHAAIVLNYPIIIHASRPDGMVLLGDASKGEFAKRECKYFSMIGVYE